MSSSISSISTIETFSKSSSVAKLDNIDEYLIKNLNNEEFKTFKPMPSPIDKIQNRFRWRIIIKGNMNEQANGVLNNLLREIYSENYKNTKVSVDVNPNSMM